MTLTEKKLYHQIHPAKLFADIFASIITLFLFWYHYLLLGLVLHFLLPALGSLFVIKYVNLKKQKHSALGKYIKKYMSGWMEAVRLVGDVTTVFGAYYHQWLVILFGLIIVLTAWFNGTFQR